MSRFRELADAVKTGFQREDDRFAEALVNNADAIERLWKAAKCAAEMIRPDFGSIPEFDMAVEALRPLFGESVIANQCDEIASEVASDVKCLECEGRGWIHAPVSSGRVPCPKCGEQVKP